MRLNVMSVSEFRKNVNSEFLSDLSGKPLTLLAHSRPVAVVVDYEMYEAMQAELERYREAALAQSAEALRSALKQHKAGDVSGMKTLQEIVAEIGLEETETNGS